MSKNGDDYSEKDAVLEYVASMNNSSDLRSGNYGCFIAPFNGKLSVLYGTLEEAKREFDFDEKGMETAFDIFKGCLLQINGTE